MPCTVSRPTHRVQCACSRNNFCSTPLWFAALPNFQLANFADRGHHCARSGVLLTFSRPTKRIPVLDMSTTAEISALLMAGTCVGLNGAGITVCSSVRTVVDPNCSWGDMTRRECLDIESDHVVYCQNHSNSGLPHYWNSSGSHYGNPWVPMGRIPIMYMTDSFR